MLGIESSCDETAAAIIDHEGTVLSNVVSSQVGIHEKFGGIVPELAARAHLGMIDQVVEQALSQAHVSKCDLGAIAVTQGPGLAGALLVGTSYAKALSYGLRIPIVGVNHLQGHIASAWLADPTFPVSCIVLVVSGGHTHLYRHEIDGGCVLLGRTRDDAAGEAFDKGAQMLGLGYPGGPAIDRVARSGDPRAIAFPRFRGGKHSLDFSFSGLKTSLLYKLRDRVGAPSPGQIADLAASYQEAIVDVLVAKAFVALERGNLDALAVVGGVSANSRLRMLLNERAARSCIRLALPPVEYCTDNAAMIAAVGRQLLMSGAQPSIGVEVDSMGAPTLIAMEPRGRDSSDPKKETIYF
ncbi:MAG: tRNA (adenosine(37)-N6)-threonylcarbamoyltransferase complex transferase subunit TsaD [Nitrospira sp.]|nr:tRNA (adenosine(37)-N6)-threonylcarbamoyltransferase complex transferase subunit TsaD [Nitrospira sp.]MDH4242401.1 tRNA (adenosine(37)-N6)-threonylcarbamoyltransferase complex transferase subunit TsaD [Nitrospira sp.]MDH4355678.1 tRNA (adenosine(37)-N6)-threonylcarbamoyltransferase complex transferase subunit TsaD [Nitrospira sp.]MDH5316910.1 tRNA (adenosine(37)-N6)-threonylcarbamoyltransferase complex transferase subunit TsaD [Nitrospira sp.]